MFLYHIIIKWLQKFPVGFKPTCSWFKSNLPLVGEERVFGLKPKNTPSITLEKWVFNELPDNHTARYCFLR